MSKRTAIGTCRTQHNDIKAHSHTFHVSLDFFSSVPGRLGLLGAVFSFLYVLCGVSCSEQNAPRLRESLMKEYSVFADSVNNLSYIPISSIPSVVSRWHTLEDDIFYYIALDSIHDSENLLAIYLMSSLGEMVNCKINSAIDHQLLSFPSLLDIQHKIACSCFRFKKIDMTDAIHFYESLDYKDFSPDLYPLSGYILLLDNARQTDYNSWDQVQEFLIEEDSFFQAFLRPICHYDQATAREVIKKTEDVCSHIATCLDNDNSLKEQLYRYMVMRTNRRLILSASYALENVLEDNISSFEEASGALTSIISPFVYFSSSLLSLRTPSQFKELQRIGERLPIAMDKLDTWDYCLVSQPDSLPDKILKDFIAFVMNN